ncbi:ribbon-helix-helix domain-containing protein [Bradyrhizobium arachidis]|uniref:Aryl-sulfate sulfotransferase n=1 Tax=Bradyrhizobium arachidis TaxID=858423 RepID=A0AAE7THP6_9BRAD|nr:ribbon-helix-helix domain-containing protein [Bradyrhizobium arachidis]QOZ69128.1 aryl-sulfate sulfotransferase [Bradyrhizobium arachidis]SFV00960.1 Ribbon-helix-helix domain-containing protein [Bradyrhizobium arachidis]
MKSHVAKRSIIVGGHKTSISLEEAFWTAVKEISRQRDMSLSDLASEIERNLQHGNLSSAIRVYVLGYFKNRAADAITQKDHGISTAGKSAPAASGRGPTTKET